MSNFDPYFDYNVPCEKHIHELHEYMNTYFTSRFEFLKDPSRENFCRFFEYWEKVDHVVGVIKEEAYTIPVIVHIAGAKKRETNPDDENQEGIFQRCTRCGSVLRWWHEHIGAVLTNDGQSREIEEDDIPWWKPGEVVAKSSEDVGFTGMYPIEPQGRELHRHEIECANLSELDGS